MTQLHKFIATTASLFSLVVITSQQTLAQETQKKPEHLSSDKEQNLDVENTRGGSNSKRNSDQTNRPSQGDPTTSSPGTTGTTRPDGMTPGGMNQGIGGSLGSPGGMGGSASGGGTATNPGGGSGATGTGAGM